MEQEKKKKTGHCIVTYRVRLYDRHYDWLQLTKELYTKVVAHFFHVLMKEEELLQQSDFLLLRALEEKCIGTKEMKKQLSLTLKLQLSFLILFQLLSHTHKVPFV